MGSERRGVQEGGGLAEPDRYRRHAVKKRVAISQRLGTPTVITEQIVLRLTP